MMAAGQILEAAGSATDAVKFGNLIASISKRGAGVAGPAEVLDAAVE
jgi:hypothetical protein